MPVSLRVFDSAVPIPSPSPRGHSHSFTNLSEAEIIVLWLQQHASENTRSAYARDVRRLQAFVGKPLDALSPLDLIEFADDLRKLRWAPISRGRTLSAIRSLLPFLCRAGLVHADLSEALILPRRDYHLSKRILSEEDVQRMVQSERGLRNRTLLLILYAGGLRVSEACALHQRDLETRGGAGQIQVTGKGGRRRVVLLPEAAWRELASLADGLEPDVAVFRSRNGNPLDRSRVLQIVRQAACRAGIAAPVSPHWLRHAHASHALDHGAPIHLVQATLGHASVATTSRYLHARPNESSAQFLTV